MTLIDQILLVDDDDITNMIHTKLIKASGKVRDILIASDGLEALELLENLLAQGKLLPELIFLDINMPRMGGFEFLEEYAKRQMPKSRQMIIVMVSTSLLEADHRRVELDPNVHGFSNKPITQEELNRIIDDYVSAHAAQTPQSGS